MHLLEKWTPSYFTVPVGIQGKIKKGLVDRPAIRFLWSDFCSFFVFVFSQTWNCKWKEDFRPWRKLLSKERGRLLQPWKSLSTWLRIKARCKELRLWIESKNYCALVMLFSLRKSLDIYCKDLCVYWKKQQNRCSFW